MADDSILTNDQIRAAIIELSGDDSLGPVTDSTRKLYLRKLDDLRRKSRESQARLLVTSQSASEAETDEEQNGDKLAGKRSRSSRKSVIPIPNTASATKATRSAAAKIVSESGSNSNRSTPERVTTKNEPHADSVRIIAASVPKSTVSTTPKPVSGSANGSGNKANRLVEVSSVENSDAETEGDFERSKIVPVIPVMKFVPTDAAFKKPAIVSTISTSKQQTPASLPVKEKVDTILADKHSTAVPTPKAACVARSPRRSILPEAIRRFSPVRFFRSPPRNGAANQSAMPSAQSLEISDLSEAPQMTSNVEVLDCIDEEHALRAHIFDTVCLVYQRVLRLGLYTLFALIMCFAALLLFDASRQQSVAQRFGNDYVAIDSGIPVSGSKLVPYAYCEVFRIAKRRCVLPPVIMHRLLLVAEETMVYEAQTSRCSGDLFDIDYELNIKASRIGYLKFREALQARVQADTEYDGVAIDAAAEYLTVLFGESQSDSLFRFTDGQGNPVKLTEKAENGLSTYEIDVASVKFVEPTDLIDSQLPFLCRVRRLVNRVATAFLVTLHRLFVAIIVILLVSIVLYCLWYVRDRKVRKHAAEQERIYAFVERIFEYLQSHSARVAGKYATPEGESESEDGAAAGVESKRDAEMWIPILHVRDALITPRERSKATIGLWDRTVALLKAEESRVRFSVRRVEGEEFECVRLTTHELGRSNKVWQGRAFHGPAGAKAAKIRTSEQPSANVNSSWKFGVFSGAPRTQAENSADPGASGRPEKRLPAEYRCLKVSQMFDPLLEVGDDWQVRIEDAILEKCTDLKSGFVNHIFVDKRSRDGVVYAKFSTAEAARDARDALHGWWFGGRLLIAKYVSVNRYVERFADARNTDARRLKPSNLDRRSLQEQPFTSVFENS